MSWRESIMALLLLAAALFLWQLLNKEEPGVIDDNGDKTSLPGYYLNEAELTRFNEAGKAQYTIKADKIEQDPNTNVLNMSNIVVEYHDSADWLIKADEAQLPTSREEIIFTGNVVATQNSSKDKIRFNSDSLQYNIETQQLSTNDRITVKKGMQVITAKGMLLDMQKERVQLRSQVKIRFNP